MNRAINSRDAAEYENITVLHAIESDIINF